MIGVLAGWVFLRFGIIATLVWHYTVDAVLMSLFLLRSGNIGFKIAGGWWATRCWCHSRSGPRSCSITAGS